MAKEGKVTRLLKGYKNVDELNIKVFPLVIITYL